jgi:dimethylhistidine N-methyltransferase
MTAAPVRTLYADGELLAEILSGLRCVPKTLPARFFYDAAGAELFERICELPEYYLTRSEISILEQRAAEIAAIIGPRAALIEYGSGAGTKVRLLLDALDTPRAYVPVDISIEQLENVALTLSSDYRNVQIIPVCADYTTRFELPPLPAEVTRRVAFFPGSTIGNFHPAHAAAFLSRVRTLIGRDGLLILGIDRVKDSNVLNAAYNDSLGVTREFNLNMLHHVNAVAGADFQAGRFEHVAFFSEPASRIEMHLKSLADQTVEIAGEQIGFEKGETIWTESSYKYSEDMLDALLSAAGFSIERLWSDMRGNFWVAVLSPQSDS